MGLVTGAARPLHRVRAEADARWATYESTVHTGGTLEQRQWACAQAVAAEDRVAAVERALKTSA